MLTSVQQLELMRAAYKKAPTDHLRASLAHLMMLEEAFDEVVELLSPEDNLPFHELSLLANSLLSIEGEAADREVIIVTNRALDIAANDYERADALSIRGKAETRLGDLENARETLLLALRLDPENKDACKRIAAIDLAAENPQEVLSLTDDLLTKGTGHARLFAAQALAHARAGETEAAQAAVGLDELLYQAELTPPEGWESIEAFNEALAAELIAHPAMRYERYGSASELTWRIEAPNRSDTPMFNTLVDMIIAAVGDYVAKLADNEHPWVKTRPEEAWLRNWCVITESKGFENWHVHQFGWLSGVYYVQIPESISGGVDKGGCIAFGLPEDLAGEKGSADFGQHLVRPKAGMFMAFPSYVYHRTFPHGSGEKRICVAFDVRPYSAGSPKQSVPA